MKTVKDQSLPFPMSKTGSATSGAGGGGGGAKRGGTVKFKSKPKRKKGASRGK